MTSIGFNNPISGSYGTSSNVASATSPGGAIRGYMTTSVMDNDKSYPNYEHIRFNLKQAWNTTYPSQLRASNKKRIITPFRAVTNSGDILCRDSYSCGGSCQSFQSRPNLRGLSTRFGSIQSACDGSLVPAASCNVKYVYDSSNYITFVKQQAINKNYNDLSNSGNNNSAGQSVFRAVRRY
uniref:Uncharacterized protein n=1 Tax=viral metagenome TaxID=1070528 RepID=A0A6C0IG07_9ZZZZ